MKAFFAGSFNPFTKGHADIASRILHLADSLVIGIGVNIDKPDSTACAERNAADIRRWIEKEGLENRVSVEVYYGLTAEEALRQGADCIARGVRNATDFDYEYSLAAANRVAFGIETILIPADPKYAFISSTLIRDLERHGRTDLIDTIK